MEPQMNTALLAVGELVHLNTLPIEGVPSPEPSVAGMGSTPDQNKMFTKEEGILCLHLEHSAGAPILLSS